jgi:RNase E specificity factor CsrD
MPSYFQTLIKNLFLGFILSVMAMLASGYLLKKNLAHNHFQRLNSLKIISPALLRQTDISSFVKILHQNHAFSLLLIEQRTDDGNLTALYRFPNKQQTTSYHDSLITYLAPPPLSFYIKAQDISLRFQINYTTDFMLLAKTMLILLIAIITFIFYFTKALINNQTKLLALVNRQISTEMSLNIEKNHFELNPDNSLELPSLKQGIEAYQHHYQSEGITKLDKMANKDSLTQVNNRGKFVQYFQDNVSQPGSINFGVLLITRCSELQTINQVHGHHEGDGYISNIAAIITKTLATYPSGKLFQLNSSDFATVLPNVTLEVAEDFAQALSERFNEYQQKSEIETVAYSGIVPFDEDKPLGELLALADTAISIAQTQHINAWHTQKDTEMLSNSNANYPNQNWRQEIDNVIENQSVTLLVQSIQPNSRSAKVYGEILARFLNSNNEMLPTASFLAMAEKLDKIVAVDRLIIETAMHEISNKYKVDQSFGINVSARSIHDEHFLIWLERRLLREPTLTTLLVFEITEYGLQQNIKSSKRFVDMIHRVGARITVEKFGVGLTSFKFFRELKPDFIKMDSTYTRDINDDKNNQYFLRLMVDLAHRLSINVLAESVESLEEKNTLEKLFIDGCQGFYIGKPTSL